MRAMQLVEPGQLELVEAAAPDETALGPGQVLVRVLAGGICGGDLPYFQGRLSLWFGDRAAYVTRVPVFPMHEIAGVVVASQHTEVATGTTVVGWATGFDGLAEYVVTSGDSVYTYARELTPTQAVLLQPLACVLHAVDRLEVAQRQVAVIGLGPIGILFCHVLKSAGAMHVTGIDPVSRAIEAQSLGIDAVVRSTSDRRAANLEEKDKPAVVVEAVGHQQLTLHDAVKAARVGGTIFHFGVSDEAVVTFPLDTFQRKHLTLISGGTRDRQRWIRDADRYLASHPELLACVTDVLPFTEAQTAFERARQPGPHRLKVVIDLRV
jgi:threonine dehydrogenase-like Zn-dependent dehydrogenase